MKCDELKSLKNIECAYNTTSQREQAIAEYSDGSCYGFDSWDEVYLKEDVDEAIAELKDKLQLDEDEMAGFLQLEEECGGGDLRNYIADLKAENKMLKEHIANGDVSRITWIDEATELKAENRGLRRALYKACANWAKCEEMINNREAYDASEYLPSAEDRFRKREERWASMRSKCLAKAEEDK